MAASGRGSLLSVHAVEEACLSCLCSPRQSCTWTTAMNNSSNLTSCIQDVNDELLYTTIIIAAGIFIVLSFMQMRRYIKRTCWGGRPGVIVPIDMVCSNPHRLPYTLIFGGVSAEILVGLLTDGYSSSALGTIVGTTASAALEMFVQSIIYFPLFACVNAPIPIAGYVIGFLYGLIPFARYNLRLITIALQCFPFTVWSSSFIYQIVLGTLASVPVVVCQWWILLWFLYQFVKETIRLFRTKKPFNVAVFEHSESTFHIRRVKSLFRKPVVVERGRVMSLIVKVVNFFYEYDPHVQYPLRFLVAVVVMMNSIYLLTVVVAGSALEYVTPLVDVVTSYNEPVEMLAARLAEPDIMAILPNGSNISALALTVYDIAEAAVYGIAVTLPIGPLFAFCWNMVLLLQMIFSIHNNLRKMPKGDLSFFPPKLPTPSYRLVAALRYAGYQIAYFIWGWLLMTLLVWLVGILSLVCYYLFRYVPIQFTYIIIVLVFPLVWSLVLYYLQVVMVKLFFVGDTNNKHTVLKNRRLFHLFSYVVFFQNVIVGLTSSLLRLLYAMLFGLLLIFRLDRVVLMKGFEKFDNGHKTYVGFLYIEHTQNNSALNVFVQLMLQSVGAWQGAGQGAEQGSSREMQSLVEDGRQGGVREPRVSRQAANRWLKAYTLLSNTSVQGLTASRLREQREREREREEEMRRRVVMIKKGKKKEEVEKEVWVGESEGEEEVWVVGEGEGEEEVGVVVEGEGEEEVGVVVEGEGEEVADLGGGESTGPHPQPFPADP